MCSKVAAHKILSSKYLLIKRHFIMEKTDQHHLNQVIKINNIIMGLIRVMLQLTGCKERTQIVLPKMNNLHLIIRKH